MTLNLPSSRRWRAALMSLVLPGFGQLYNGRPNRAIWLFLSLALLSVPALAWIGVRLPAALTLPALTASVLASLGIWGFSVVDAWRDAADAATRPRQAWQSGGVYALVFLACNGLVLPLAIDHVRLHHVASWRIPSDSMTPGILRGDILFADMRYNCPGCGRAVKRGDVAIFTYPNDRTLSYIKRIIGLPGDRVRIDGRVVSVNGQPLGAGPDGQGLASETIDGRTWRVRWSDDEAGASIERVVPPGAVFVLGDNRAHSRDSRHFETVPLRDVVGLARQVWFSKVPGGEVRWSRFGHVIE